VDGCKIEVAAAGWRIEAAVAAETAAAKWSAARRTRAWKAGVSSTPTAAKPRSIGIAIR
jgi:hypothetical protein